MREGSLVRPTHGIASGTLAVTIIAATACTRAPVKDDGTAAGPGAASLYLEGTPQELVHFRGAVASLRPPRGDSGLDRWWRVEVAGGRPFHVLIVPSSRKPPFREGESIDVTIDCRRRSRVPDCDGLILDASGQLVAALSDSGQLTVSDWSVEQGGARSSADRAPYGVEVTHAMTFHHQGKTTASTPGEWRELSTPDRSWLVSGRAIAWEGKRPSEASDNQSFAILRNR